MTPPAVAKLDDEDDLFKSAAPPPFKEAAPAAQAVPAPAVQPEVKDDLFSSSAAPVEKEIDLEDDDDDDIFKSARLEPEPAKVIPILTRYQNRQKWKPNSLMNFLPGDGWASRSGDQWCNYAGGAC